MKHYINVWKKGLDFNGRASRAEYWFFILTHFIVSFFIGLFMALFFPNNEAYLDIVINTYTILIFIPSVAVAIRRMHDINRSGWYSIIPIYSYILMCYKGDKEANRFGDIPEKL